MCSTQTAVSRKLLTGRHLLLTYTVEEKTTRPAGRYRLTAVSQIPDHHGTNSYTETHDPSKVLTEPFCLWNHKTAVLKKRAGSKHCPPNRYVSFKGSNKCWTFTLKTGFRL